MNSGRDVGFPWLIRNSSLHFGLELLLSGAEVRDEDGSEDRRAPVLSSWLVSPSVR